MSNIFEKVQLTKVPRNTFDLSHEKKLSGKFGLLYPILTTEILPGDKFQVSSECLVRMAPMLSPVMHRIDVYIHYFFVPNRLIWNEWETFITGAVKGNSEFVTTAEWPYFEITNTNRGQFGKGDLHDYLGLEPMSTKNFTTPLNISALPARAYYKIHDDYYRDQDLLFATLDDIQSYPTDSGKDTQTGVFRGLMRRAWAKDYFTSARPDAQEGEPVVMPFEPQYKSISELKLVSGATAGGTGTIEQNAASAGSLFVRDGTSALQTGRLENLESGAGVTINDLRTAQRLQRWQEKNMRGGNRYNETILNHFGVKSKDSRLQRAEYLGGGKQPVTVSEVLNTTGDTGATTPLPQGHMAGHGVSAGGTNRFTHYFTEHGILMGLMSVLPKAAYQQGTPKMFTRSDKLDYYWPEFANLGEQEIKVGELWEDGTAATRDKIFGYTPRYAEYKFVPDMVAGDFRDDLQFWHLGREFATEPALNITFVQCDPSDRIFADQSGTDYLWVQVYNRVKAKRHMPYFSNPQF